jgi:hypothetical protein
VPTVAEATPVIYTVMGMYVHITSDFNIMSGRRKKKEKEVVYYQSCENIAQGYARCRRGV